MLLVDPNPELDQSLNQASRLTSEEAGSWVATSCSNTPRSARS